MPTLVLGLILFLGVHSVSIFSPGFREGAAARLGEWTWKGLYSVVAVAGLILIIAGYGEARVDPRFLYRSPDWLRHLTSLLTLVVFPLFLAAYLPGKIQRAFRHPMLVAVKVWAAAHLLVNGTLADVILFGGFLAWAVADRISLKRRRPRPIPQLPRTAWNDAAALVGGLAIYVVFVTWAHPVLIGVPVQP